MAGAALFRSAGVSPAFFPVLRSASQQGRGAAKGRKEEGLPEKAALRPDSKPRAGQLRLLDVMAVGAQGFGGRQLLTLFQSFLCHSSVLHGRVEPSWAMLAKSTWWSQCWSGFSHARTGKQSTCWAFWGCEGMQKSPCRGRNSPEGELIPPQDRPARRAGLGGARAAVAGKAWPGRILRNCPDTAL